MTKDEYNDKMTDMQNDFIKKLADHVVELMKINKQTTEQLNTLLTHFKQIEKRVKKLEDNNGFDLKELKKEFNVKGYTNE
jgi:uncharacterized coiled-coil protein SlyX